MEASMDIYNILDGLENTMRECVNNRYLEVVNEMYDGINELVQRCLSNADTFDTSIKMAVLECKVHLSSSPGVKEPKSASSPNLGAKRNLKDSIKEIREKISKDIQYESSYSKQSSNGEGNFNTNHNLSNQSYSRNSLDQHMISGNGNISKDTDPIPSYPNSSSIQKTIDPLYENNEQSERFGHHENIDDTGHEVSTQNMIRDQIKPEYNDDGDKEIESESQMMHKNNLNISNPIEDEKQNWMKTFSLYPSMHERNLDINRASSLNLLKKSDASFRHRNLQDQPTVMASRRNNTNQTSARNGIDYRVTFGVESGIMVIDTRVLENGLVIKTYECKDCGMQSQFKNNIALHYKNKHAAVKPYNCPFCDFGIARRDYLHTHISKKHPEVEAPKM